MDLSPVNKVSLRPEIIPFRIINPNVKEEYLFRCILSENVRIQGSMLSTGTTVTRIKEEDFLNIRIVVPTLDEQERLTKVDVKQSLSNADLKLKESYDEFRRDMHMKKHAIGQTIFNLNNWWRTLQRARREGNGIVDDSTVIGNNKKILVKDIYDNIQRTLEHLQEQISKFDRGNGLVVKDISLPIFIEDYIAKHNSPLFRFDYDAAKHHPEVDYPIDKFDEKTGKIISKTIKATYTLEIVSFAPDALTIIFDNIVNNACCHGFAGRESNPQNNIIRFDLNLEGDDYVITISNNGNPAGDNVDEQFVFTYKQSFQIGKNHHGIGGYEVKRLMREFGGDAEFVSNSNDTFPVSYRLIFRNTSNNINLES